MANPQMKNTTNLLILNLAVADLLFVLVCVPFTASDYVLMWKYHHHHQHYCHHSDHFDNDNNYNHRPRVKISSSSSSSSSPSSSSSSSSTHLVILITTVTTSAAVVYLFQASVPSSIENAKYWPILARFGQMVAYLSTFWCNFYKPKQCSGVFKMDKYQVCLFASLTPFAQDFMSLWLQFGKHISKSTRADKTNFRKGICADKTDVRQLYLKIIMQFYKKQTSVWKDNWKVWSSVLDSAVNSLWMPIQFYFPQFVTPHKPAVVYLFGGIEHRECEIFRKSIFKSIRADNQFP